MSEILNNARVPGWYWLSCLCLLLFYASCSNSIETQFTQQIIQMSGDNTISADEWEELVATVRSAPADYARKGFIVNGEINAEQIKSYIRAQAGEDVQIEEASVTTNTGPRPDYNVYIENSASMDGYVQGLSDFKNTVYLFLSDIKSPLRNIAGSLNLYYINSKPIPFSDEVEDFIRKLDPSTFRQRGGNRAETDISNIIDTIFANSDPGTVNILISDCVFSPGKGKNAGNYLTNQSIGIKSTFERKLSRQPDLTTLVLKLSSEFSGTYYDYENFKHPLDQVKRPYYLWVIGPETAISDLMANFELEKLGGFQYIHEFNNVREKPDYKVLFTNRIGSFDLDRNDMKHSLIGAEKETRGTNKGFFQFALAVDLKNYGLDDSYFSDPANFRIHPESYEISIMPIPFQDKQDNELLEDYSHYALLKTEDLRSGALDIELMRKRPTWVVASNSLDDKDQTGEELNKTYGIEYLVDGISNAYDAAAKDKETYFKISVSIKK